MSFIPNTFFSGTGGDDLLTKDVHSIEQNNGTINSVYKAAKEALGDVTSALMDRPGALVDLARIVSNGPSYYSKADVFSRVAGVLGAGTSTGLGKLSGQMQDTLFGALGVNKESAQSLKLKFGDVERIFAYGDVSDARNQLELLSVFAGDSTLAKLFDLEAESAWVSTIINGAVEMGIPEILDIARNNSSDQYVWKTAYAESADRVFQSGNLSMIDTLIEGLTSEGAQGACPNGAQYILSNYRFDPGVEPDSYPTLLAKLLSTLNNYSAVWDTYNRNGVEVVDLMAYRNISEDSRTLLQLDPRYAPWANSGTWYIEGIPDIAEVAQAFYPEVPILPETDERLLEITQGSGAGLSQSAIANQVSKYL